MATDTNIYAVDLWDTHRRAIESIDRNGGTKFTQSQLVRQSWRLNRAEAEQEFHRDRSLESRDVVEVGLQEADSLSTRFGTVMRRLARQGVPVIEIEIGEDGPRLSERGSFHLSELIKGLRVPPSANEKTQRALLSHAAATAKGKRDHSAVRLRFVTPDEVIGEVPVDLVVAAQPATAKRIARYLTREDWLRGIGALPTGDAPIQFAVSLPVARLSSLTEKANGQAQKKSEPAEQRHEDQQWVITPSGRNAEAVLRYLHEAIAAGYRVSCVLTHSKAGDKSDEAARNTLGEVAIDRAVPRFQGERPGIYFRSQNFNPQALEGRRGSLNPVLLDKFRAHAELFWTDRVTHFVAPIQHEAIHRLAYAVPKDAQAKLIKDIAEGGESAKVPVIEAKTPVYRLFADIDLPWELFNSCSAFADLKKAQCTFFGSDAKAAFDGLRTLVACMYPPKREPKQRAAVSRRRGSSSKKEGYHVVFPGVLLPNDGRHGLIAVGQLEAAAAKVLDKTQRHPLMRFLLQVLLDDRAHLGRTASPLTFRLRRAPFMSGELPANSSEFVEMCCRAIVLNLRDGRVQLSDEDNAALIRFALRSMGATAVDRHIERLKTAATESFRVRALARLARRCRWEVLRRARYFDHSVYAPTMGLRLLGTAKPGDPESVYEAQESRTLNPEIIMAHSIRARGARPSAPARAHGSLLSACGLTPGRPGFAPQSLDGLVTRMRAHDIATLCDLSAEFRIHPKPSHPDVDSLTVVARDIGPKRDADRQRTLKIPLKLLSKEAEKKSPGIERYRSRHQELNDRRLGKLVLYPPRRYLPPLGQTMAKSAGNPGEMVHVRVRVFIPSPIVAAPGNDYGGDGRGAKYDGGTSRLQVDVYIDPKTALVRQVAAWGESSEYDSDDTVSVPGKPDWWRDKVPGAQPVETDTLPVDDENVKVSATKGAGGTALRITYSGALPLSATAPPIDGDFTLTFNDDGSLAVSVDHDGFPAHTLYVNEKFVYGYDPAVEGGTPWSLAGEGGDVQQELRLRKVPSRPSGTKGKGPLRDPWNPDRENDAEGLDAGPSPDDGDAGDAGGADDAGEPLDDTDDAGDSDAGPGGASAGGSSDGRPAVGDDTEGEANAIVTPLEVDPNADGSVTLTLGEGTEDFTYSASAGGWVGEEGSFLIGGPDLFDDTTGWSVTLSLDENGNPSIEICHGGQCEPVRLDERYTP